MFIFVGVNAAVKFKQIKITHNTSFPVLAALNEFGGGLRPLIGELFFH